MVLTQGAEAATRAAACRFLCVVFLQGLLLCALGFSPEHWALWVPTGPPKSIRSTSRPHFLVRAHLPPPLAPTPRKGHPLRNALSFDPFAAFSHHGHHDEEQGDFRLPDFFEKATEHVLNVPEPLESEIVEEVADISSGMDVGLITNAQQFRLNSFAGFVATMVSAALTFPIDTLKTRLQAGRRPVPTRGNIWSLYRGVVPSMLIFCPTVSVFVGLTYWLKAQLMEFAVFAASPRLQLMAPLLAGALTNLLLSIYRVPTSMMIKLIQTGVCSTFRESLRQVFWEEGCLRRLFTIWVVVLMKDIPNGALRIGIYQFYEVCLRFLQDFGYSAVSQRTISGIVAGMTLGVIINPVDLVVTRAMTDVHASKSADATVTEDGAGVPEPGPPPNPWQLVRNICGTIYAERGLAGFFAGALVRALSRIPSTCIWFATFDIMKAVLLRRWY